MRLRVAADIGGTFTDIVAARDDGTIERHKIASTPDDFGRAAVEGILAVLREAGAAPAEVTLVVHATTVATNAILEGRGARTALLTTRGFRDVLELRRVRSPVLYDQFWRPPPPLVPRHLRLEVEERTLADGSIEVPLDEASVGTAVERALALGADAIAVAFLHAYRNAAHERRAGGLVRNIAPHAYVSLSSEVLPEVGEYERTSTTVINAYVGPIVSRYLGNLERRLHESGTRAPVFLMQSNGSVLSLEASRVRPAAIVESGPAAGVVGASNLAAAIGLSDLVTFDMGGTTTKAALIEGGRPAQTSEYEVGAGISTGGGMARGRGYALRLPVLDIAEVGAGGGSIVRVSAGGALLVGPASAGAVPGPAAYGMGGTSATVADATLVLGYLNPVAIAGGAVSLHPELARAALRRDVAGPLGLDLERAAHGVFRVAIATMARAVRAVTTYRGRSPSAFNILAFGGNGPLFAADLARELEMSRVIIPAAAGLFSSVGLLDADEAVHLVRACAGPLDRIAPETVAAAFEALRDEAAGALRAGVTVSIERRADLRYRGQSGTLTVPFPVGPVDRPALRRLGRTFADEHRRSYGYAPPREPMELVNVRVVAAVDEWGGGARPSVALSAAAGGVPTQSPVVASRRAYFGERNGWLETPLLSRADLAGGRNGPLIVDEYDATILVPPGCRASLDSHGLVVIEVGP